MSDPSKTPWSNDPNAPQIPSLVYFIEKKYFAGVLLGVISYGIVVALFFQCMGALLNPVNDISRGIRWAFAVHTVALFLFLTIPIGIDLDYLAIEYINNREFPGSDELPPGPVGYDIIISSTEAITVFGVMFPLNQWLADGLLLHRCCVVYSMNHWTMAFPYLMYLASVGTCSSPPQADGDALTSITDIALGIAHIYSSSGTRFTSVTSNNIAVSYYSICLSLSVLLTLMIIIQLILHIRNVRKATGASDGSNGLHTAATTVVTMLVESYALYMVALLSYVVSDALESWVASIFAKVIGTIQVMAPYLIILRVAKRRAMTSETISGTIESIHFRSQRSGDDDGSLPTNGEPVDSVEVNYETPGELVTGDKYAIEEVPL